MSGTSEHFSLQVGRRFKESHSQYVCHPSFLSRSDSFPEILLYDTDEQVCWPPTSRLMFTKVLEIS